MSQLPTGGHEFDSDAKHVLVLVVVPMPQFSEQYSHSVHGPKLALTNTCEHAKHRDIKKHVRKNVCILQNCVSEINNCDNNIDFNVL